MSRLHQILLIVTSVSLSWLAMQVVHELGHVLGAIATGARVEKVVLFPLAISRTDVTANEHPLVVAWAGPILGITFPLLCLAVAVRCHFFASFLMRFFAGFCLVANGSYIAFGAFDGVGDSGDLLHHGSPIWTLWLFGVATVPLGFVLWNGLDRDFGIGRANGVVNHKAAYLSAALLALTVLIELCLSVRD